MVFQKKFKKSDFHFRNQFLTNRGWPPGGGVPKDVCHVLPFLAMALAVQYQAVQWQCQCSGRQCKCIARQWKWHCQSGK
jgi:hypothetical protein